MALTKQQRAAYRKARSVLTEHAKMLSRLYVEGEKSADDSQALVDEIDDNRFASIEVPVMTDDAEAWLADALAELDEWQTIDETEDE